MVGLINKTVITLEVVLVLLLNIHFNIGIRERIGMPELDRSFSVLSIPPNKMVSSLCTLKLLVNWLMDCGGGEPSVGIDVKSEIVTLIPSVTWSFPDTT